MDVKLKVLEGKSAGKSISIPGKKFIIGRAEDCQLRPTSDLISRYHCALVVEGSYLAVRDFGSKNGTFVNGDRVTSEQELKHGDRLKIGPLEFIIEAAHELGGKKRPPVSDMKEAAARTATGSSASKDVDVSSWLEGSPDTTETVSLETPNASLTDTEAIRAHSQTLTSETATPPAEPEVAKPTHPGTKGKHAIGKLPQLPQAKDSGDAAADVLSKLRKRR